MTIVTFFYTTKILLPQAKKTPIACDFPSMQQQNIFSHKHNSLWYLILGKVCVLYGVE